MKLVKTIIDAEKEIVAKNSYDDSLSQISNEFLRYKRNYDCPFNDKKTQIILDFIATNAMLPMIWRNGISFSSTYQSFINGMFTIMQYLNNRNNDTYFFIGPKYLDELTLADIDVNDTKLYEHCLDYAANMLRILKKYSKDIQERYMD